VDTYAGQLQADGVCGSQQLVTQCAIHLKQDESRMQRLVVLSRDARPSPTLCLTGEGVKWPTQLVTQLLAAAAAPAAAASLVPLPSTLLIPIGHGTPMNKLKLAVK
jgi:hypothetical protein